MVGIQSSGGAADLLPLFLLLLLASLEQSSEPQSLWMAVRRLGTSTHTTHTARLCLWEGLGDSVLCMHVRKAAKR